jgi:uncharacterized protein YkwD
MPRWPLIALLGLGLALGTGCATAQPGPDGWAESAPPYDLPSLEQRVLDEVNRTRRSLGRAALRTDSALVALARAHSEDMLARGFFAHRNPDGRRAGDRARAASYPFRAFGENLFRGHLYDTVNHITRGDRTTTSYLWHTPDDLAALAVAMWMESPGHRDNMLSPGFDAGGIGVAAGPDAEVMITLNLSGR